MRAPGPGRPCAASKLAECPKASLIRVDGPRWAVVVEGFENFRAARQVWSRWQGQKVARESRQLHHWPGKAT